MSAPKPAELIADLRAINDTLNELATSYRWLYPLGYERAARGKQEGSGGGRDDGAGGVFVQRAKVRSNLDKAGRKARYAREALQAALAYLNDIQAEVDRTDHLPGEHGREVPRTVTMAELAAAQGAQRRRTRRGEGYGQS